MISMEPYIYIEISIILLFYYFIDFYHILNQPNSGAETFISL